MRGFLLVNPPFLPCSDASAFVVSVISNDQCSTLSWPLGPEVPQDQGWSRGTTRIRTEQIKAVLRATRLRMAGVGPGRVVGEGLGHNAGPPTPRRRAVCRAERCLPPAYPKQRHPADSIDLKSGNSSLKGNAEREFTETTLDLSQSSLTLPKLPSSGSPSSPTFPHGSLIDVSLRSPLFLCADP